MERMNVIWLNKIVRNIIYKVREQVIVSHGRSPQNLCRYVLTNLTRRWQNSYLSASGLLLGRGECDRWRVVSDNKSGTVDVEHSGTVSE